MIPGVEDKIYNEIVDLNRLNEVLETYLDDYNSATKIQMPLCLFQYAIHHISRISRILKQDNSHALLIGIGTSGRQSLTRLASFMAGYDLMQIEITSKTYGPTEWRHDLKKALMNAGADGKHTVFLFADTQIKDEIFVEDISMILNAGDIPNLFEPEERGEILGKMQIAAKEYGKKNETSPLALYNMYLSRLKCNLHIVLAMSPSCDAFRLRLHTFPSLISWPKEALIKIAQRFIPNLDSDENIRDVFVEMCVTFHESVRNLSHAFYERFGRRNYVTHASYLELIRTFKILLDRKRREIEKERKRYTEGLDSLDFAAQQVAIMRDELAALQREIIEMLAATEILMKKIEEETIEAEATKKIIAAEEIIAMEAAKGK
jgi:dynein heavy chain